MAPLVAPLASPSCGSDEVGEAEIAAGHHHALDVHRPANLPLRFDTNQRVGHTARILFVRLACVAKVGFAPAQMLRNYEPDRDARNGTKCVVCAAKEGAEGD